MTKKILLPLALIMAISTSALQAAERYIIDTKGMHASISFKVKHLGYSWLQGRFNNFSGEFNFDEAEPANNNVSLAIDVTSLDSNHAERDKHLRGADFFDVKQFPDASFISTDWQSQADGSAIVSGDFTLRGISKQIKIVVNQIGAGDDPWGGFRRGFEGKATLQLSDYGMEAAASLGQASQQVELWLAIEGIRQ